MKPATMSFNASHPLHKDHNKRVMPKVPGRDAQAMAATAVKTTRNWRTSRNGKLVTPGVNTASPCGGYVSESQDKPRTHYSKNARRKMERYGIGL